jgi:16S rRNA (cytosine967-C5)-methyltransferase
MRRRLDLRWRIREDEIGRLSATQRSLLEKAAPVLRPGGTLVYSTCSLEPEENTELICRFLSAHPDFHLQSERTLLPFRDAVDGAYVAKLTRLAH